MPVPKRKKSKSRRRMRNATHKLTPQSVAACPNCGSSKLPHRVCIHCGYYRKKYDVLHLEDSL